MSVRALGTMVTYGYPDLDLDEELALATRFGVEVLEILPDWSRFPDPVWSARCSPPWAGDSICPRMLGEPNYPRHAS